MTEGTVVDRDGLTVALASIRFEVRDVGCARVDSQSLMRDTVSTDGQGAFKYQLYTIHPSANVCLRAVARRRSSSGVVVDSAILDTTPWDMTSHRESGGRWHTLRLTFRLP